MPITQSNRGKGMRKKILLFLVSVLLCLTACNNDSISSEKEPISKTSVSNKVQFPVKSLLSNEEASLKITNKDCKEGGKLPSEKITVMDFNPDWAYNHVPHIIVFKGKLIAMWSSGKTNEDDLGQRVMYSVSEDFYNWSEPKPLLESKMGIYSMTICSADGFYDCGDTLYAYCGSTELMKSVLRENGTLRPEKDTTPDMIINTVKYVFSTNDGVNWNGPTEIKSLFSTTQNVINSANGRDIAFIGAACRYNDSKIPATWNSGNADITDAEKSGVGSFCEACGYITDDNIIHMLIRNNSGFLYHAQSLDNGETWSSIAKTNFANEQSMANAGRLPDGTYYIIANSDQTPSWDRLPLYLYTSSDGYNYNTRYIIRNEDDYEMQKDGIMKGGHYAYPTTVIYGDYMYIIYSKQKEVIELTRIDLNNIIDF